MDENKFWATIVLGVAIVLGSLIHAVIWTAHQQQIEGIKAGLCSVGNQGSSEWHWEKCK